MKSIDSIIIRSMDDYEELCNDLREEVNNFDINDFYKSDDAKALMIITPKQVIICPVLIHNMSLSSILYYLYGINTDLTKINNIVVRLDSHNDKFFVPTIPIRINKFQSDVFSYYFDQLKPYSNELKYSSPRSIVDWNYEEVKEQFERCHIDDSFVPVDEQIISCTSDDWYRRVKVA